MDAYELSAFRETHRARLVGARVQRLVCVTHGLVLELQNGDSRAELGLLTFPTTARAYWFENDVRTTVHREVGAAAPELAESLDDVPQGWSAGATRLDALRAWLLRPAAQPPEWLQLEGAKLRDVRTREHDRRLWLEFERRDALDRGERLVLLAELFDRGANFILRAGDDGELANWKGRRPAPDVHASKRPASDTPTAQRGPLPRPGDLAATLLQLAPACARDLLAQQGRAARRHERRVRARLRKLEADAARAEQAQTWRRMGEALTAHMHQVRRGAHRVTLDDPYAPGESLEIELDPALSPQENAARFFKRARRAERGRETIVARLNDARAELEALAGSDIKASDAATAESHEGAAVNDDTASTDAPGTTAMADWSAALERAHSTLLASLTEALAQADAETLWSPGGPRWERPREMGQRSEQRAQAAEGPGRRFLLPGDWEVRVGRNNVENDELTHRFAHADDVWLHASAVPGSHVVLRMRGLRDNPPRDVLNAAAAIAARFSRAKHAGTVPVIWTRKRYVRKPRKSKPGTATCTHEKTVFVQPGLPAGEDDDS